MDYADVAFLKNKVALLSHFPEEKLQTLTSGSQIITPAAGETITRAGEELHFLGVVLEGKIGAFAGSANGDEQSLGELRPGDTFGEMALMNGEPGIVDFLAVESSRVMLVPLTLFQSHIMSEPRALQQISRTITERLQTVMSDPRKAAAITRGDDVAGLLELKGERPEHILVLNSGSSSLKYTYFETEHPESTTRGCVECIGKSNTRLVQRTDGLSLVQTANSRGIAVSAWLTVPVASGTFANEQNAQVMQDAEKAMFPYVAINPTDGYYSPTKDSKYPALLQRLYENLNDIVLVRQPFSYLDQAAKEWLDNGGSQMRTEFEREIAASRGG